MGESTPKKLKEMTAEELLNFFEEWAIGVGENVFRDRSRANVELARAELLRRLTPAASPLPAEPPTTAKYKCSVCGVMLEEWTLKASADHVHVAELVTEQQAGLASAVGEQGLASQQLQTVLDHKFVANECHDHGCHFLFLQNGSNCAKCPATQPGQGVEVRQLAEMKYRDWYTWRVKKLPDDSIQPARWEDLAPAEQQAKIEEAQWYLNALAAQPCANSGPVGAEQCRCKMPVRNLPPNRNTCVVCGKAINCPNPNCVDGLIGGKPGCAICNSTRVVSAEEMPAYTYAAHVTKELQAAGSGEREVDPSEVPDLYRLAYIPGVWRCPKCEFVLSKSTLSAESGNIGTTPKDRQSEPCPNDGEWLVPVTYKESISQYEKRLLAELDKSESTSRELSQARESVTQLERWLNDAATAIGNCDLDSVAHAIRERVTQLEQELLERTTQRNLAREARENWRERAEAAESRVDELEQADIQRVKDISLLIEQRDAAESSLAALKGQNGWVSAKERLPKEGQKVDIAISAAISKFVTSGYHVNKKWWCGVPAHYVNCEAERWEVTHWKLLPELPDKAEREER